MKSSAIAVLSLSLILSVSGIAHAISFDPAFAADYSYISLGTPPGVPPALGGLTLAAGDPNTLLIGGSANLDPGAIYSIGLTRDLNGHITGFSRSASLYSTASHIDGGLSYGPGNVLFYTAYPGNGVGQIKPGSSAPDKVSGVFGLAYNLGSLVFVPPGFAGAGQLKAVSYTTGEYGTVPFTPDGTGTFDLSAVPSVAAVLVGGPEGMAYVSDANTGFSVDSMLVAEYSTGRISIYDIDANGDPVVSTRRDFLTGLTNAEGAFVDPVTGDFLFSTFNGGNSVFVVRGFIPPTPEPASIVIAGVVTAICMGRRRGRTYPRCR